MKQEFGWLVVWWLVAAIVFALAGWRTLPAILLAEGGLQ
jgi:hypothetical protein